MARLLPDPAFEPMPPNIPPRDQAMAPFLVDDGGSLTTAYENAGIVTDSPTTAGRRELARDNPWTGGPSPSLRKLTHFRAPGMGDAMWSGQCTYDLAGVSPSFSYYDDPDVLVKDDGVNVTYQNGVVTRLDRPGPGEGTTTRRARLAAHQDTAPAASFFQGYWNPRWSGLLAGFRPVVQPRPLHVNFNPGQMGSKELHRATEYKPVPPMGSIVGYFGTEKAL